MSRYLLNREKCIIWQIFVKEEKTNTVFNWSSNWILMELRVQQVSAECVCVEDMDIINTYVGLHCVYVKCYWTSVAPSPCQSPHLMNRLPIYWLIMKSIYKWLITLCRTLPYVFCRTCLIRWFVWFLKISLSSVVVFEKFSPWPGIRLLAMTVLKGIMGC